MAIARIYWNLCERDAAWWRRLLENGGGLVDPAALQHVDSLALQTARQAEDVWRWVELLCRVADHVDPLPARRAAA